MKKLVVGTVLLLLSIASAFADATWTTGKYDPARWTANANNLLREATPTNEDLSFYNENGKTMAQNLAGGADVAMAALADGVVPGEDCDYNKIVGIAAGCNMYWTLADAATLDSLTVYSRWGDGGRDGINLSYVQIKHPGDEGWTEVGGKVTFGNNNNDSGSALFATLSNEDGTPLAKNVIAIRIRFSSSQDNYGSGYVEIEAAGSMASLPQVQLGVGSVEAWAATLSGTVTDLVGAEVADIYFAYGTDASSLEPVRVKSDLSEGATFEISLEGLNDSTVYHYSYYLKTNEDKSSTLKTGVFTTGYAQPLVMSVSNGYFTSNSAELLYDITNLGELGTSADLYFAYGTSESLTPTLRTEGLTEGAGTVEMTGLSPATTYYYAIYAKNQLGHFNPTITGSFTTYEDSSVPKWTGVVSSDWSEPRNWEPETTFVANTTVDRVILNAFPGRFEPTNLDIEGLTIDNLGFGHGGKSSFSVAGKPFTVKNLVSESGAAGTMTVRNEITVNGCMYNNCNNDKVCFWFAGVIHQDPTDDHIFHSGSYGNVVFSNPSNDFTAKAEAHLGTFGMTCDGALGFQPTEKPNSPTVWENYGLIRFLPEEGKNYNPITFGTNRFLRGGTAIHGYTDVEFLGGYGSGFLDFRDGGSDIEGNVRQVTFAGSPLALEDGEYSWADAYKVEVRNNILLKVASESVARDSRRHFSSANGGTVDFNGYDVAMGLYNYSYGIAQNPNYINNRRGATTVLTGPIDLGYDYNTTFFGGAGDIVLDSEIKETDYSFSKRGPGRLTFRDVTAGWRGGTRLHGPVTLDYTTKNEAKLGSGALNPGIGFGEFRIKGHATEATTCELAGINLNGGLTQFVTEAGAEGLTLNLTQGIQGIQRQRALDLCIGEGTQLAIAGLANDADFGGISPAITLNRGAAWAMADGDGNLAPLSGETVATVTAEAFNGADYDSKVLDVKGGVHAFATGGHWLNGLIFSGSGDTTLTIDGYLTLRKVGVQNTLAGILVSSACTGDVTIDGGTIVPENYNSGIVLQNWNTNGKLRISSLMPETNDNDFSVVGPGTTELVNDGNSYYYGPHSFGGGTVRFTSIANKGAKSAMGKGNNDRGEILAGDGTTYEYIGTAQEGHKTNRRFTLFGSVTLKANGAGPLVFNGSDAVASQFSSCRVILDGAGEGVLDGTVNPGLFGAVIKRGTGTWTVNSRNNKYVYPTEVEAGTLVLGGALASDVIVKSGATLVLKPGALMKRSLTLEKGATLVYDNISELEQEPAIVWGSAKIDGNVRLARRPKAGISYRLVSAENGCAIGDLDIPGMKVICDGQNVILRKRHGFTVVVK